jgi:hypothetical protein
MADKFESYVEGPESWRWLFGTQLKNIGDGAAQVGITAMKPAILQLASLSSIHLTKKEIERIDELRITPSDDADGSKHMENLYAIQTICVQAANRAGAWKRTELPFAFMKEVTRVRTMDQLPEGENGNGP